MRHLQTRARPPQCGIVLMVFCSAVVASFPDFVFRRGLPLALYAACSRDRFFACYVGVSWGACTPPVLSGNGWMGP